MSAPHRRPPGGGHARRTLALLVPLAAVLIGAGCTGGEDDLGGEAVARVTAGDMVEFASGGGWVSLEPGDEIPSGARLRTGDAEARVAFRSGDVWLAPQAAAEIVDDRLDLLRGEALVTSGGDLWARWSEVEVKGEGVYRLTPGIAPRLGVYSGQVQVRRGAEVRTVPALRETSLSARRLPSTGQPLSYRSDDPWDQALLPDEIAFDNEAERLVRGLARQYGTTPRPAEFYGTFAVDPQQLAGAPRANGEDWRRAPPGEALLQLFVAQAAAGGADALEEALHDVGELRAAGARWGLVATELGVTTQRLAEVVDAGQARYSAMREERAAPAPAPSPPVPPQDAPTDAAIPQQATPPAAPDDPPAAADAPPPDPEPPAGPPAGGQSPGPQPVPDDPDAAAGAGDDAPPRQPQPNPTDLLSPQQPSKGLIESVVELLLGLV